jgi:uncharacterized protein
MIKALGLIAGLALILGVIVVVGVGMKKNSTAQTSEKKGLINQLMPPPNPLSIEAIKQAEFPGSEIKIEETLASGSNYKRYRASYASDGLKIYGLLTVPDSASANSKAPAIVFAHGYIPPEEYRTEERYIGYVDSLARAGYVVFKIDYRGHDQSEGEPSGAYFSPGYTIDTLNAAASLKKLPYVNTGKIGFWGHSMAGMIGTRAMAAKPDEFQAAVIWGGVVGSYEDIQREWWSKRRRPTWTPSNREMQANRPSRQIFIEQHGEPTDGNSFWDSISPTKYLKDFKTPIQLDHGESDETVPVELSRVFAKRLQDGGKTVELYTYPGSNHDIAQGFNLAMQRTVEFFDKYLK